MNFPLLIALVGLSTVFVGGCAEEACAVEGGSYDARTRVPLSALADAFDVSDLPTMDSRLVCNLDAGVPFDPVTGPPGYSRTEGCGLVTFSTSGTPWRRTTIFDAESGELVGAYKLDDVYSVLPGTSCSGAAFIAGVAPTPPCEETAVRYCTQGE
jgi:hypothetical protein